MTVQSDVARRLVVFDLDRTLISGSSLVPLASSALRAGVIGPGTLAKALSHNLRFAYSGERGDIAGTARAGVLGAIKGWRRDDLDELVVRTVPRLVARIRPSMRRAVDLHLGLGDRCVVVSASPHEIVHALAVALGAELGIGTRGRLVDGRFTGELDGPFCHGAGKLLRMEAELGPDIDLTEAVCYADSVSDLPLLEAVGVPIVVAPDRELRRLAASRGWSLHET